MKKLLAPLSLIIALAAYAGPEIPIFNSSFEIPTSSGNFNTVYAPSAEIPGWLVTDGSVDHIWAYWPASDGTRSVDLDGYFQMGTIEQTISIPSAGSLLIGFDLAGNPDGSGDELKTVQVSLLGGLTAPQIFTFDASLSTLADMNWVSETALFDVPAAGDYRLVFQSLTPGAYGPALDNVSAEMVPDAASTLALLGMGIAGLACLRRKVRA